MKHFDGVPFCLTALSAPFSLILRFFFSLTVSFAVTLSALSFAPFWLLFAALAQAFALAGFSPLSDSSKTKVSSGSLLRLSLSSGEVKLIFEKQRRLEREPIHSQLYWCKQNVKL